MRSYCRRLVLAYLRLGALLQLKKTQAEVIGITGSAGKTSCRMATSLLLASKHRVRSTEGGLNSEWGVPLSILNQESGYSSPKLWLKTLGGSLATLLFDWRRYDKYVMELGVDKPNDMEYLLSFLKPKVGVVLNVSAVHTEQFTALGSDLVEQVGAEKSKLVAALPPEGTAILNYDDPQVKTMALVSKAQILSFGLPAEYDLWADQVQVGDFGFRMLVHHQDKIYSLETKQWLSSSYAYTFLAALAVGLVEGIDLKEGVRLLGEQFTPPPGRHTQLRGLKGSVIIDSSYNASKRPTLAALAFLASFTKRRKIAALGDMRELGPLAQPEHEAVAAKAVQIADEIVTVGPLMQRYFVSKALDLGFPKDKLHSFLSSTEAGLFTKNHLLRGGEVILVKGSQNTIFMERLVETLLADPETDRAKLCRRGAYWDQVRRQAP